MNQPVNPKSPQSSSGLSGLRGAVDLGSLAAAKKAQAEAEAVAQRAASDGVAVDEVIFDATRANFQERVINQSMQVPVVVDLWAEWCGPCKQLSPTLEKLALEAAGAWVLAKVNVDLEQEIAAAFQVQSIPTLIAIVGGQPVPLFQGALPEAQVRQVLDQLLAAAKEAGLPGRPAAADSEPAEASVDPLDALFDEVAQAYDRGDSAGLRAAYDRILALDPDNADARAGIARLELEADLDGAEPEVVIAAAGQATASPAVEKLASAHVMAGDPATGFDVLINFIAAHPGDESTAAREHLLRLFEVVGSGPEVSKARQKLANALF